MSSGLLIPFSCLFFLLSLLISWHFSFLSSSLFYTCSLLFPPLVLHLLISPSTSVFSLPLSFSCQVFFGVMIACYVVSQLWVIRFNIISKAINGRQYLCVFYSLPLFFSLLPEHINKLTFYPYRLKINYIQGNVTISRGAE